MSNFSNELKEYQNVPRKLIFDNTISDRARFVFCFMAAKPDDWNFYMTPMAKELGYSVDTLRKYINELVERGWLEKGEQEILEGGIFGSVKYTLKANLPTRKNSDTVNFGVGKNTAQHNIDKNIKDIKYKKENKEDTKVSKKAKINWRADIEVYRKACEEAKDVLADDKEFEAIFLRSFPNADYYRSILKSLVYWESEIGWATKKKSKSVDINMVMTLKKNLDKNVVYKNAQDKPIQNERLLHIEVVDKEGTLADGTIFKEGHRYYYSEKYGRLCSIPVDAVERPDARWEWDNKKGWYLPEQKETIDDVLW